jgi:hypothetical protein
MQSQLTMHQRPHYMSPLRTKESGGVAILSWYPFPRATQPITRSFSYQIRNDSFRKEKDGQEMEDTAWEAKETKYEKKRITSSSFRGS